MSNNRTIRRAPGLLLRAMLAGLAAIGVLAFAPSVTPAAHASGLTRTERVHLAFRIVKNQLGDPYRYGATGPNAFDCSGLVYYAYHHAGFDGLPRTSSQQAHFVRHISRSHMRVGDFVFFYGGGGVYHVGVYDGYSHGHRYVIHAPYPGAHVRRERIWTNSWYAGTMR